MYITHQVQHGKRISAQRISAQEISIRFRNQQEYTNESHILFPSFSLSLSLFENEQQKPVFTVRLMQSLICARDTINIYIKNSTKAGKIRCPCTVMYTSGLDVGSQSAQFVMAR